jgi:hypothetical protein
LSSQYRLHPLSEELSEAVFQRTPMEFATDYTTLEWADGQQQRIPTTLVSEGTLPVGGTWAKNPLPHADQQGPPEFAPPCGNVSDTRDSCCSYPWPLKGNHTADAPCAKLSDRQHCCFGRDPVGVLVLDKLVVPAHIEPGQWVLGFRWDCERSAQVWQSCADVTIVA